MLFCLLNASLAIHIENFIALHIERSLRLIFFSKCCVDVFSLLGYEIFGSPREMEAGFFKGSVV